MTAKPAGYGHSGTSHCISDSDTTTATLLVTFPNPHAYWLAASKPKPNTLTVAPPDANPLHVPPEHVMLVHPSLKTIVLDPGG
eukprot:3423772-Rhodomonas_salina.3